MLVDFIKNKQVLLTTRPEIIPVKGDVITLSEDISNEAFLVIGRRIEYKTITKVLIYLQ